MSAPDPRAEYERRRDARRAALADADEQHRRIGRYRLATAVGGLLLAWAAFDRGLLAAAWLWLPVVAFAGLVAWHESVKKARDRAQRGAALYEAGLARLDGRWEGHGARGEDFLPDGHLYAVDLDLFGEGSLFQLLSRARTRHGERRLADWLASPSEPAAIAARQEAIEELRPRLDLREDIALAGEDLRDAVDADRLAGWGQSKPALDAAIVPALAAVASLGTIVTFSAYSAGLANGWPLVGAVVVQAGLYYLVRDRVSEALRGVDRAASDLGLLAELVARLERERLSSRRGAELQQMLRTGGSPASAAIRSLRRRVEIHDSGRNLLFMPIAILLLWPVHGAYWIDRWRERFGDAVGTWLEAAGEIEALSSLASHAYEHPEDAFAEIVPSGASFEAQALGHPLLPVSQCVRNDVRFGDVTPALIVSGSNMSGKTTLLRAVGSLPCRSARRSARRTLCWRGDRASRPRSIASAT